MVWTPSAFLRIEVGRRVADFAHGRCAVHALVVEQIVGEQQPRDADQQVLGEGQRTGAELAPDVESLLAPASPPGQRANRHDVPRLAPGSARMSLVLRTDSMPSDWSGWRLELRCGCGLGAALPVPWLVREGGEVTSPN
jgi:hypothetical protein